eukprot:1101448-Pleurochrysis_carterae.AAC.1
MATRKRRQRTEITMKVRLRTAAPDLLSEPTIPCVIYLCSGVQRDGDLAAYFVAGGVAMIHVDYERGGIGHDLASDVTERVTTLATSTLCVAVVATNTTVLDMLSGTLRTGRATSPSNSRSSHGRPAERRRLACHSHTGERNYGKL